MDGLIAKYLTLSKVVSIVKAAPDEEGPQVLDWYYMLVVQVGTIVCLYTLYCIYRRVKSGWKRQYTLTSCSIMKQPVLDQLTHNQDTDIFLQLTSTELGISEGIYISSIKGHPMLVRMSGELWCHNLTLHRAYLHDSPTVPWHHIEL